MAEECQPTRRMPRSPQPRLASPSTPAEKPRTQALPTTERPTTRVLQKAGIKTGRVERNLTSRSIPKQSRPPNPMFIVGGIVGTLFLMVLIIVAAASSGASGRRNPASNDKKKAEPVEPATLEREAMAKCEEGRTLIQKSYILGDRAGLQRGVNLIIEGNTALERVNQMTGKKFDTRPFNEALKMARVKLGELK